MLDGEPCLAELRQEAQCSGCKGKLAKTKMGKNALEEFAESGFFFFFEDRKCTLKTLSQFTGEED